MIAVYIQTDKELYINNRFSDEIMDQRQMEQLLDVFDFSLVPQPGDPALLSGLPVGYDSSQRVQTVDGYTIEMKAAICDGNLAWVTLAITLPGETAAPHPHGGGRPHPPGGRHEAIPHTGKSAQHGHAGQMLFKDNGLLPGIHQGMNTEGNDAPGRGVAHVDIGQDRHTGVIHHFHQNFLVFLEEALQRRFSH